MLVQTYLCPYYKVGRVHLIWTYVQIFVGFFLDLSPKNTCYKQMFWLLAHHISCYVKLLSSSLLFNWTSYIQMFHGSVHGFAISFFLSKFSHKCYICTQFCHVFSYEGTIFVFSTKFFPHS